jgi:hypothetical protein
MIEEIFIVKYMVICLREIKVSSGCKKKNRKLDEKRGVLMS